MKHLAVLSVTAVLLAACGPDSGTTPPPGPNPTPPVSTAPLPATQLSSFATTTTPQIQSTVTRFASNLSQGAPILGPFSTGANQPGLSAQGLKQADIVNCSTEGGDQTDADKDSITVNGVTSYDCSGNSTDYSYSYKGSTTERDKNDADAKSGYAALGDWTGAYNVNSSGLIYNWKYGSKYNMAVDPIAGGGYTGTYAYGWNATGTYTYSGQTGNFAYDWQLNMTMKSIPDANGTGTRVTYAGSASVKDTSQKLDGFTDFTGDVHYANGTNGCYGIDSGTMTYKSGTTSLQITYTGCNVYKTN